MRTAAKTLIPALALLLLATPAALAEQHQKHGENKHLHTKVGSMVVEQAWARASLTANGAAYVSVRNAGSSTDQLIEVRTPAAKRAELHTHLMDKGIMRMRPLKAIEVNPGAPAVMRPGGDHIMLMGLTRKLKRGERFPITLRFAKAGEVTVMVTVMGPGARGPAADPHKGHTMEKKDTH